MDSSDTHFSIILGVMPEDCVQYACVFRPEWVSELSQESASDSLASQHVLAFEEKGLRVSYEELRKILAEAIDPTQSAFLSPSTQSHLSWAGPPIPSTVNICVPIDVSNYDQDNDPYSGEMPLPVVFCFRRTRQRQSVHQFPGIPSFRLDDEIDFASLLVKRLAPTPDMEILPPDTWEELVHDGTDWLLGRGSMLPPKSAPQNASARIENTSAEDDDVPSIPLDEFEKVRAQKLATLRSRMAAEAMQIDRSADVEAVTIRGMIQKAVGLAFVRASKIVLGVSVHVGSGIVIARLSDGTWSAPSAIGTCGAGLGLQFGVEVAEYIFILQTQAALDHFKRGGSFTIGGNMGMAVAGVGREAYGAASLGGGCGSLHDVRDDEYNDNDSREEQQQPRTYDIAPIVAYAKCQGFYAGVSLEGSRIYARDDINRRAYKFAAGRDMTAADILAGKVSTPREAEGLYAALHSVEFMHEMSCLPRPPEILRRDSANPWRFNQSTLGEKVTSGDSLKDLFGFIGSLSVEDYEECEQFETQFKCFLYGGVSVQRLVPGEGNSNRTGKERRTLWLMLPEVGALRLGFVSKLSDGEGALSNKSSTLKARRDDPHRTANFDGEVGTVGSEDVTLDSALNTKVRPRLTTLLLSSARRDLIIFPCIFQDGSMIGNNVRSGNVQLSHRHSVALTDVTILSQEPLVPIKFKGEDKTEHLRVITIQDTFGTTLVFLANNFREAELLVCGLKLLLERETTRLGIRGGIARSGGKGQLASHKYHDFSRTSGTASEMCGDESTMGDSVKQDQDLPVGRPAWGNVPGRDYMRGQAASLSPQNGERHEIGIPSYDHGQQIVRDIARNVRLPLALPLCRVLLLDSTSPVIKTWEKERGDFNFDKTRWSFPPAASREPERHTSEHQLITSGSMRGANRTTSFDRPRYGSIIRLSETHAVDTDDSSRLVLSITERNPRRGFSVKVRLILKAIDDTACDGTVVAEIRPVGKDMSNQAAVHKAFTLVVDEVKQRYGRDLGGLVGGLLSVVDNMNDGTKDTSSMRRPFHRTDPTAEEKKVDHGSSGFREQPRKQGSRSLKSGLVSFEEMLRTADSAGGMSSQLSGDRPSTPSFNSSRDAPDNSKQYSARKSSNELLQNGGGCIDDAEASRLIEVKPLPKIRLSLMPSPREEDEDDCSSGSPMPSAKVKKKKKMSSFRASSINPSAETKSRSAAVSPDSSVFKAGLGRRL
jgi:lipid-binding SYLF domain-containing protein